MILHRYTDKTGAGRAAAECAVSAISRAIRATGSANIVLATGVSQYEMLDILVTADIDWSVVTAFHLDEYIGIPGTHPASFRKYLRERFVDRVGKLRVFHFIEGNAPEPADECRRLGALYNAKSIALACIGIGENGHLAFNDPPADFETTEPYIVVELDEVCRKQQVGEGWFAGIGDVPTHAISMSINGIMRAETIVCTVSDLRKAAVLKGAVEGPVTPDLPSSILQRHSGCHIFADDAACSLLGTAS
jgi:glucosamine-6-phosphate deaminase